MEWIDRTEADDDAERLEFAIGRKTRMSWLNTEQVRGIGLEIGTHLDVVSSDRAQPPCDPLAWVQDAAASRSLCTKCGQQGRQQWFCRQYGADLQRWCPKCMSYNKNNMPESTLHTSDAQPMIVRLRATAENAILHECTP